MAHVALIETYPYEAVWGGDAVYLDGLRTFLLGHGHRVESYITDMTRGRSNPTMRLPGPSRVNHRWRVRQAIALGDGHYCSLDPRLLGKALRRLPGGRAAIEQEIAAAEAEWVADALERTGPDLAILAFGACAMTPAIRDLGIEVLALKGFFSDRRIRLGEQPPIPSVDRHLLESLAAATRVGFNNQHDLDLYASLSGRSNGVVIGMGFPERVQSDPDGQPTLLFVGARTRPNIESLHWFLDKVWPAVRAGRPDASVRVVGSIGAAFAAADYPGVAFLGFVDRLADEYRGAAIAIAPLVSGSSGIKTKIAEALSFGRPVITTTLGVDPGSPGQYGEAVIVADDPVVFAKEALDLLGNRDDQVRRSVAASAQYHRHFTEHAAYRVLIPLLVPVERGTRVSAG